MYNNVYCNSNITINKSQLINQYYNLFPDPYNHKEQSVIFGTSGHRGSSNRYSFNEAHILAISQSIVYIRKLYGVNGPCYVGKDTHILSEPAFLSVLEVLTANCVNVIIQRNNEYTPTPIISHAIVDYNRKQYCNNCSKADGIIITSSHNPPDDGGIKYSSIFGGPAATHITNKIEFVANKLLISNFKKINRITLNQAWNSGYLHFQDFAENYINNLPKIINIEAIKSSGLKIGIDPLSGSSIDYWHNIVQKHQLDFTIIDSKIDQTFSFMNPCDDGRIRIDCSSESTLKRTMQLSQNFDLVLINDPDCDRYGIITSFGLIKSDDYFAIVANYLFQNRPLWNNCILSIGKTNVSNTMINSVAFNLNRQVSEVPVGFKWFSKGLFDSHLGLVGEESAGASFLDWNCIPWSTDKDGLIMCLLAAEIIAVTNRTLQEHCSEIYKNCSMSNYNRTYIDINYVQQFFIFNTLFQQMCITELGGDPVICVENLFPFSQTESMSNIKIITQNGWIACRLSGTELLYKIYCESFIDATHRQKMEKEMIEQISRLLVNNKDIN